MSKPSRITPFLCAVVALCACNGGAEGPAEAPRPAGLDLLLITVDTLRADRLGCYGHAGARTPAIDGLARRGVRFEQAVCGAPITLPSHATILTGLDVPDHGVRHNGTFRLAEEHVTLAEVLADHGYATAAFVGAFVLDRRYGLAQGFEHYDDAVGAAATTPTMGRYSERPADEVVGAAMAWLDRHLAAERRRPFMLWTHFFDPHAPYEPPGDYAREFAGRPYDGEIAFTDAQIGRLLDYLEAKGVLERTLVVFTSDHGEGLGEHDEPTHADLIYDTTVRVPLIFSGPALSERPRSVGDRLAASIDVLPTTLALLGIDAPGAVPGRDLLGGVAQAGDDRAVYVETLAPLLDYGWAPLHALRRLEDKLILAPTPEYYVISADPAELDNRYAQDGPAAALREELERRLRDWPPALEAAQRQDEPDDEAAARLSALGYVRATAAPGPIGVKDPKAMMGLRRRMERASELALAGQAAPAAEEIRAVLGQDPSNAKAWYIAVQIHDLAGRHDEAESSLRRALALEPKADGWVTLARYALNRGAVAEFERALDEARRLDPQHGGVAIGRGHALAMQGRLREARREFERAIEIDPVRSGAHAREQIARIDALLSRGS